MNIPVLNSVSWRQSYAWAGASFPASIRLFAGNKLGKAVLAAWYLLYYERQMHERETPGVKVLAQVGLLGCGPPPPTFQPRAHVLQGQTASFSPDAFQPQSPKSLWCAHEKHIKCYFSP